MNLIEILQYLLLGIVQGVSEILPISSSGHLALLQLIFQMPSEDIISFSLLLHGGSLLALVIYFFPLLWRLATHLVQFTVGGLQKKKLTKPILDDVELIVWLAIATVPAALAGLFLQSTIESIFSAYWMIGVGFLLTAILLNFLRQISKEGVHQVKGKNAWITGLFQMIGIFPGISRSGMTILGGRLSGLSLSKAKEFAFLLFIPITIGAFLVDFLGTDFLLFTEDLSKIIVVLLATLLSGITTWITLKILLTKMKVDHFIYFSYYLIGLGLLTIVLDFFL